MTEWKSYCYGAIIAAIGGPLVLAIEKDVKEITQIYVPATTKVEQSYVVPSKLEIKCEDLNGNGLCETIVKYDGKQFLLKYDENKIVGSQYEVKPSEIVPK